MEGEEGEEDGMDAEFCWEELGRVIVGETGIEGERVEGVRKGEHVEEDGGDGEEGEERWRMEMAGE